MRCTCKECHGTGKTTCYECDGLGETGKNIEETILDPRFHKNYSELVELQRDAKRCIKQAAELCEVNPSRKQSYNEQLKGCLEIINQQATKAYKSK